MDIKDIEKNMKYISTCGETLSVDEWFVYDINIVFDYAAPC